MKRTSIVVGALLILAAMAAYIGSANPLVEIHKLEVIAETDQAFTPAIPMLRDRYQNIQLAAIPIALAGIGILIYGTVKK